MANNRFSLSSTHINPQDVKKSSAWFAEQVKNIAKKRVTPGRIMTSEGVQLTTNLVPGRLFFFYYDPKFKMKLPYYDTFPMVIPYDKDNTGFMGLNLHYLDYPLRMDLLKELLKISGSQLTDLTKIKFSWSLIQGVAKYKIAQPCVKRYLHEHVRSPFCAIPTTEWHTAMLMPVQRFVGATKEQVWAESIRKARNVATS